MSDILKIPTYDVVGRICCIWLWFDANTTVGSTKSNVKFRLDKTVEKVGFCDAMISVGWMMEMNGEISIPNYERHNSKNAKSRALGAKRNLKYRLNKENEFSEDN